MSLCILYVLFYLDFSKVDTHSMIQCQQKQTVSSKAYVFKALSLYNTFIDNRQEFLCPFRGTVQSFRLFYLHTKCVWPT